MDDLKFFINPNTSIREAIRQLDETAKKILLVIEKNKLSGVLTDGDIRRWILKNGDLERPVYLIMNHYPIYLLEDEKGTAFDVMRSKSIEGIPILNKEKEVVDLIFWNEEGEETKRIPHKKSKVPVVIMAGGKGTRLYPFTNVIPKPLIPIGDIPIVERIMNQFHKYGYEEFYMTTNYKKEMIKAYFAKELPYHVNFLEEEIPRGTAASLSLMDVKKQGSFFVSNCDVLLDINYEKFLAFHQENQNKITLVVALKNYEIPYGVVSLGENGTVRSISEKPNFEFLINTGVYIMESDVLQYIPEKEQYDMTDLINDCLERQERVGAYPVMDSVWLDMGEWKALQHMEERLQG